MIHLCMYIHTHCGCSRYVYIYIIRCCFWPKYKTIHCVFSISVLIYVLSFQNMQRHNLFTNHLPCFLPEDRGHMRVMTTLDQRPDADHRQVRHFIPSVSHISMVPCWFAVSSSCGSKRRQMALGTLILGKSMSCHVMVNQHFTMSCHVSMFTWFFLLNELNVIELLVQPNLTCLYSKT